MGVRVDEMSLSGIRSGGWLGVALKLGFMATVITLVAALPFLGGGGISSSSSSSEVESGLIRDAEALLELKRALVDEAGVLDNWRGGEKERVCSWTGVVCERGEAADEMQGRRRGQRRVVGLALEGAGLGGTLSPSAMARLPELRFLLAAGNSLSASLADFQPLQQLQRLEMPGNLVSGPVPAGLLRSMPRLKHLLLPHNNLVGRLDPLLEGGGCGHGQAQLTTLDLAGNYLSGGVPAALAGCARLEKVDLRGNSVEGPVPEALAELVRLSGDGDGVGLEEEEGTLGSLVNKVEPAAAAAGSETAAAAAAWIRDRYRRWSRSVVAGRNSLSSSLSSSSSLSGSRWRRRSMAEEDAPAPAPLRSQVGEDVPDNGSSSSNNNSNARKTSSSRSRKIRRWALGLALGLVAGGLAAVLLATILRLLLFLRRKPELVQGPIIFHKQITPKMLEALEQPNSFQEADSLGQGGSGRVYKKVLQPGDVVVAVKLVAVQRGNQDDDDDDDDVDGGGGVQAGAVAAAADGGDHRAHNDNRRINNNNNKRRKKQSWERRQIQSELQTLGSIRHRNLVALLAYVARPDDHLLVYEFMENGSLHSALSRSSAGELVLDWPCRLRIAHGMATGVAYLHTECRPKVVHRDIKPANVLLDANLDAHIGDFGLAKVLDDGRSHASTAAPHGTLGYMAPEYHQTAYFTTHSDIYSLGVTLAALLCGKEPTDAFFQTHFPEGMPAWLAALARDGRLQDAVDPRLRDADRLTDAHEKEVVQVLKLVVLAMASDPAARPSAADLLKMLDLIASHDQVHRRDLAELIAPEPLRVFNGFGGGGLGGATVVPRDSSSASSAESDKLRPAVAAAAPALQVHTSLA